MLPPNRNICFAKGETTTSRNMANQPPLPTFSTPARHPARYSAALLPVLARYLQPGWRVLDPFGGVGGLAKLARIGADIVIGEIEYPILAQAAGQRRVNADATTLPFPSESFDCIVTSPTYGNRMADHALNWNKDSHYNTYDRAFGFKLHPRNTGGFNFGEAYRQLHRAAWSECQRVLKPGGLFILNISDHIRNGEQVKVSQWHLDCLFDLGFELGETFSVKTPRLRYGANHDKRTDCEYICVLAKL